ncbi:FAD/NAD(P)-binding domain-containing protein [Hypoxylon sp. FL1150]|nr:FAD/NAD(P)-binding domain-containing protein [Hypoxylon sp. FL1150]
MTDRIRIGIIAGGLAGITVAIDLAKHPHVDVQVYEAARNFMERGVVIGLSPLALETLNNIIPSAVNFLENNAGAVEVDAARPEAGTLISDLRVAAGVTMDRALLLQVLLSLLSEDILHASKRVKSLEQTESDVRVTFEDGTDARFDAVIGADGIFSSVRKHVVGEEHAASPAGWWDCKHLVPFKKTRAVLGDESFNADRQYAWLGDGAAMLHDIVENRTMVQCIIAVVDKDPSADRKRVVTRQVLEAELPASWYEGPVAKGMIEPLRTLFILGHLFGNVSSPGEIKAAFRAFDAVRRPRYQPVIDIDRGTDRLFCGQDEGAGLDPRKLNNSLGVMFGHVGALNLESHKNDALEMMRVFLDS